MVVVVSEKVQESMQREHAKLVLLRVTGLPSLTPRYACRDDDVA
jgi:hypothetical protein